MDITLFTDNAADVTIAVAAVGAAVVAAFFATQAFGFVTAWGKKLMQAAKGRAAG